MTTKEEAIKSLTGLTPRHKGANTYTVNKLKGRHPDYIRCLTPEELAQEMKEYVEGAKWAGHHDPRDYTPIGWHPHIVAGFFIFSLHPFYKFE